MDVKTRILIISDTHGKYFPVGPGHKADVVIHCGDLTDGSTLDEYRRTLQLLNDFDAPLKLVIAGNHDFTLDAPSFRRKVNEVTEPLDPALVRSVYGEYGEARRLFDEAPDITFLDEGTHQFHLANGSLLTVYASPYTPSEDGDSLQYHPSTDHEFAITKDTDVVITHGPPRGIMDRTCQGRAGCTDLFAAVARARPRVHCFGHIHQQWGAKFVTWRPQISDTPSHFTDIDNGHSTVIDTLRTSLGKPPDTSAIRVEKVHQAEPSKQQECRETSHCHEDPNPLEKGKHTLFVNAAAEGVSENQPIHPRWIVDINLPKYDGQQPITGHALHIP
ncbi:putative Ser Thr protein phosphatase family protein [Rosellinia necatrix]|uniref:Putative Ser Thr protein phosphatase family protein n=1 Tax=Rosellinia necatrix TaxID=77044 RepID=A0A1W2TQD6_ROSNE|nr:putative Ser Thr protein phosphatase family protein [Rosellinia necatrix]